MGDGEEGWRLVGEDRGNRTAGTGGRALVLGGGGITGIAWELGLMAGLAAEGIDVTTADLVVGTSAGSVVGALLGSSRSIEDLYQSQLRPATGELAATIGPRQLFDFGRTLFSSRDLERSLRRLGRRARTASSVSAAERREVIAGRLQDTTWPTGHRLVVTAIDTGTGRLRTFDGSDGVPLVDAVAASCAVPLVWPPVPIEGALYMDGGLRSPANVDLAAGYDPVLVLAPMPRGIRPGSHAVRQLAALGPTTHSLVLSPDESARTAIGRNALDPARRAGAARAGLAQAASCAAAVRAIWETRISDSH